MPIESLSFAEAVRSGLTPEELAIQLPNLAIGVMGQSGAGKTFFLGTFPKPILVHHFDPPSKDDTYENLGFLAGPLESSKWGDVRHFYSPKDPERWIIRVEYFGELDPRNAKSFSNYMARMNELERDLKEWQVRTLGLDSVTFFELSARFYNKFSFHPTNKKGEDVQDERIHYAASARMVEEFVVSRYPGLQRYVNICIIAHIQKVTKDDFGLDENERKEEKEMAAPGKQVSKIPASLSEVYRLYVDVDGTRRLQTAPRPGENIFECKSIRQVPDRTVAHFKAIEQHLKQRYETRLKEIREK